MVSYGIKNLEKSEIFALQEMTGRLQKLWPDIRCILFGSKVSGNFDSESDIDVLIIFPDSLSFEVRRKIIHIIFEINLHYESNISPLIVSADEWTHSPLSVLPLHATIGQEGVTL